MNIDHIEWHIKELEKLSETNSEIRLKTFYDVGQDPEDLTGRIDMFQLRELLSNYQTHTTLLLEALNDTSTQPKKRFWRKSQKKGS